MKAEKQIQKLTWKKKKKSSLLVLLAKINGIKKKKIRSREILKLSIMGKKYHTTLPTYFKAMII